jgi:hypothetical protein
MHHVQANEHCSLMSVPVHYYFQGRSLMSVALLAVAIRLDSYWSVQAVKLGVFLRQRQSLTSTSRSRTSTCMLRHVMLRAPSHRERLFAQFRI